MAFDINTKANIPFKKILGKAHTSNDRDPANEPETSGFITSAQNIWAQSIHLTDPNHASNTGIIAHGDGVNSRLKLDLLPVSGTNNYGGKYSSYYVTVPSSVPAQLAGKINPKTGSAFAGGDRIGNLIPETFGFVYIAKPFSGNTEIPPSDASDYFIDYYSGILTQETDSPTSMVDYTVANSHLEAYVYVGLYVADQLDIIGTGATFEFYDYQTIGSGVTGAMDGTNKEYVLANTPDPITSVYVHVNGMLQYPGENNDYTCAGNTITFTYSPQSGDSIIVNYRVKN